MSAPAIEDIYPLSPAQKGMFLRSLSIPDRGLYIEQCCSELEGGIDIVAFESAWNRVVDRHTILRSAFLAGDLHEPMQIVSRRVHLPVDRQDWREFSSSEQGRRLEDYLAADRSRGFELDRAPLMRVALIRTGESTHYMIWTHHHLLLDGWSAALLLDEIHAAYGALSRGAEWHADPPRPFREYISWLERQDFQEAEGFWRRSLAGYTEPTPLGRPAEGSPPHNIERYATVQGSLTTSATRQLQSLAREHHLTLNTFVQGAWAILLSRYSGRQGVVFGTTVSGRPPDLEGVERMMGLFINTLPLRIDVRSRIRLRDWLPVIQAEHAEARKYEYCSTGQVHQWSELPGALPLYESIVVFQNYPAEAAKKRATDVKAGPSSGRFVGAHTEYPVTILAGASSELMLGIVYDRHQVGETSACNILRHLLVVLDEMAGGLEAPIDGILASIPVEEIPIVASRIPVRAHDADFVVPQSSTEKALAELWTQVLGIEDLSVNDNFFDLRGHSLLATQLLSRVRDTFQVELPLNRLFEMPTLGQLSRGIEEAVLTEIEALSEEDARRLVDGRH
jgi:acyl carrier protein